MNPNKQCKQKCANYGSVSACQMCLNKSNHRPHTITIDVVEQEWGQVLRELA